MVGCFGEQMTTDYWLAKLKKLKTISIEELLIGLVYLLVALLPLTYRGTIEVGFTIKLSEIAAITAFSLWFLVRIKKRDFSWKRTPLDIPLLGFLVVTALSLTQAINLERGIAWWLWLASHIFGICYLVVNVIKEEKHIRGLLKTYVIVAAVIVLFSIYQFFADYMDLTFTWIRPTYSKFGSLAYPRPHATLKEPLLLGSYLLLPTIFLAVSFLSKKTLFFRRWVEGGWLLLFITVVISTLSRGAMVALGGALALLTLGYLALRIFRAKEFKEIFAPLRLQFLAFAVIVALSFPLFWGMTKVGLYLEEIGQTSSEEIEDKRVRAVAETSRLSLGDPRWREWKNAWQMFKENPILGVGWENFGSAKVMVSEGITETPLPGGLGDGFAIVNNQLLEVAVESGVLGLLAYLGFSAVFAWQMVLGMWRSVKQKLYAWVPVFAGFLLTFLAMSAQFMTFSTIQIAHFWLVLGLGIAALQNKFIEVTE